MLNRGFIVTASISIVLFIAAIGTAHASAEREEMTPAGSSSFNQTSMMVSLSASIVSLVGVFLGIGAFVQKMKDQAENITELRATIGKMTDKTDSALKEFHQNCEVYRSAQAASISGVKDTFAVSLTTAAEAVRLELHTALDRMWSKYDDLESKHNSNRERLIVLEATNKKS